MRKEPKTFKVEVKRRPALGAKKSPFMPEPAPQPPAPAAAVAMFKAPAEQPVQQAEEPARRILPCLVTEAALDAAKAEALTSGPAAPRPRGRPRKLRGPDELPAPAPRKRGRPRKVALLDPVETPVAPVTIVAPRRLSVPSAPVGASERSIARRAVTSELPRSERWKRRLPKALR